MNPTPNPMQDASEPCYTVEEFLAHLKAIDPYELVCWEDYETLGGWSPGALESSFEALKKGGPHGR